MKIKLPLTEKFLWDLYNFRNKTMDLMPKLHSKRYGLPFSDFNIFRDEWTDENKKKYLKEQSRKKFSKVVQRLREGGYLKTTQIKSKNAIMITTEGINKLFSIQLKMFDKKIRQDKKWQMVLFDIPENNKIQRDRFRRGLQYLGFKKLQKSIWVCQYDVINETKNLIKRYGLKQFVELLLVEKIGLG